MAGVLRGLLIQAVKDGRKGSPIEEVGNSKPLEISHSRDMSCEPRQRRIERGQDTQCRADPETSGWQGHRVTAPFSQKNYKNLRCSIVTKEQEIVNKIETSLVYSVGIRHDTMDHTLFGGQLR